MWLKRILIGLVGVLFVLALVFTALAWRPVIAAADPPDKSAFDRTLIAKGAQLALIGNCNTCHTK